MARRRDDALIGLTTLILVLVELAWIALIAYFVLRLLRAAFPEVPR